MARGRPKGSKNKAKDPEAKAPETGNGSIGHNKPPDLTEDEKQALALQWMGKFETSLAAKNKAASEHSNLCKRMKTEIGDDAVDLVKDMLAMRSEEGEAKVRAAVERQMRAARYMAAPMGSQFEMFPDRMPAEERAFAEGKRDAMAGEPLVNSYDPSVPQHDQYAQGWHAGQKAVSEAQRKRDAEVFDGTGPVSLEEAAALEEIETAGSIGGAAASFEVRH